MIERWGGKNIAPRLNRGDFTSLHMQMQDVGRNATRDMHLVNHDPACVALVGWRWLRAQIWRCKAKA
jgi:hypothetical protein